MTSVQQRDVLLDACMVVIIIKSIVDIAFHHQKNIIHAEGIYSYACEFVSLPLGMIYECPLGVLKHIYHSMYTYIHHHCPQCCLSEL